jgi:hypothetical protein
MLIEPKAGRVQQGKSGSSLREGFLYASKTWFPPSGKMPDELLFLRPQYNTWIELMYDQNQRDIMKYARAIRDHRFPTGVLMVDDNSEMMAGARVEVEAVGGTCSPRSTAFLATRPAASMTPGLEVLVQEVIAAIITEPCPISDRLPLVPILLLLLGNLQ